MLPYDKKYDKTENQYQGNREDGQCFGGVGFAGTQK